MFGNDRSPRLDGVGSRGCKLLLRNPTPCLAGAWDRICGCYTRFALWKLWKARNRTDGAYGNPLKHSVVQALDRELDTLTHYLMLRNCKLRWTTSSSQFSPCRSSHIPTRYQEFNGDR